MSAEDNDYYQTAFGYYKKADHAGPYARGCSGVYILIMPEGGVGGVEQKASQEERAVGYKKED